MQCALYVHNENLNTVWSTYRISPGIGRGLKVKNLGKILGVVLYARYSLIKVEILDGTENMSHDLM